MINSTTGNFSLLRLTQCFLSGAMITLPAQVMAQTSPLETIIVTGTQGISPAVQEAPTIAPLDAVEPTSVISQDFIQKNLPPSTNYDEAIKFSPSVFDTAPNGPGLAESQNISIRGFQDGQFNVTFDGIPWGDSNDFTHHTTSYFMGHDLGEISVDRGPGTAATIGNATFGGTVGVLSKAPDAEQGVTPYLSYGSFNTVLYGAQLDSGVISQTGGTRVTLDAEGLSSDGYLTNMGQNRMNIFLKAVQPIGDDTTLTFVAMYNHIHQGISLGTTAAEITQFGPNYALSRNPDSQNYYGYNFDRIATDFEYVDLASTFGDGWSFDGKLYTYGYYHHGFNGEDPNGEFPNGTIVGGTAYPNDVPGQALINSYRSVGTIARLVKDFSFGDIKTGIWYDHQANFRSLTEVDMSQGLASNTDPDTGVAYTLNSGTGYGIDRLLTQALDTVQPYVQVDWSPIDALTLSPGVRWSYFSRDVNATVNVKTGAQQSPYDQTFDALLPSFEAHYAFSPQWTAYAQAAEGFLAPNENFFNYNNPASNDFSPEKTWNYQTGTALQFQDLAASADVYYIDFTNFITTQSVGGNTVPENLGGVTYMGLEGEATYAVGSGFSLYANGTVNSAKVSQTHEWVPNAPDATWALGVLYDQNGFNASLLGKFIGSRFGDTNDTQGLSPLFTMDLAAGYKLDKVDDTLRNTTIRLELNNIANVTKIMNLAGYTVGAGTPLYWTQPGRSVFVTISTTLN
jgi:iron complex outermembrane receptor protein